MLDLKALIPTFSAIAEVQDVLNAANAGAVCRPALPNHMDVVNVVVQEHFSTYYLHPCSHPEGRQRGFHTRAALPPSLEGEGIF